MTVTFNYVIAHNLPKESKKPIGNPIILDNCFNPSDQKTVKLAQSIYESFGKESNRPDIGQFKIASERGKFAASCCLYANKKNMAENDFIALTHTFTDELKKAISKIESAIGGYIVCLHYTDESNRDFILFAIIRDEDKLIFTPGLELQETSTINTNKLRLAFKINLLDLEEFNKFESHFEHSQTLEPDEEPEKEQYNFLYVVAATERDKTDYFADVIGYTKGLNSKKSTELLFTFIEDKFSCHKSLQNKIQEAKDKTANYFTQQKGKPVSLEDLKNFYQSEFGELFETHTEREDFFGNFIDEMVSDKYGLPYTFVGHRGTYNKHTHITIKNDDYELKLKNSKIDTDDEDAEIYWNQDKDYINIRVKITDEIRAQLADI